MIPLDSFREHCLRMSTAEHLPDCPSITARKPFWQSWALSADGMSMRWRGPEPPWVPPRCDGCTTVEDRELFARMAREVESYVAGELPLA